jgi:hypothetical protein
VIDEGHRMKNHHCKLTQACGCASVAYCPVSHIHTEALSVSLSLCLSVSVSHTYLC